jgi:hypothetical protein
MVNRVVVGPRRAARLSFHVQDKIGFELLHEIEPLLLRRTSNRFLLPFEPLASMPTSSRWAVTRYTTSTCCAIQRS